jgi:hypothetical protein
VCRLSIGNAVVPGGEHFPRKGAFVRLAGENELIIKFYYAKPHEFQDKYFQCEHAMRVLLIGKKDFKKTGKRNIFSTPFYRRWP